MLSEWLRSALEASGKSQTDLARHLTEALGKSIDRAAVNKMTKGTRGITAEELMAIERFTGWEAPSEIQVPLKGDIGAGAEVIALDDDGDATVPAPRDARPGSVAVRVRGDSMHPAYEAGTLIYYSQTMAPEHLLNRRAVMQLGDGRIFVKVVRAGSSPNTWNLQSLNPLYPEMEDEVVEWAAPIDWIKPR